MLIPTNSERPMFKRFHEFVIEQNNGNTEAGEQTLYDVAYSLFYESHALRSEKARVLMHNGKFHAQNVELEEQNEQLRAEIEQTKAKFEKLASNYVALCDEIDELQRENAELKSKLSLKEQK